MWRHAYQRLSSSVQPVIQRLDATDKHPLVYVTVGTAFCINQHYNPTFITCGHVVADGQGEPLRNLVTMGMYPGTGRRPAPAAAFSVLALDKELDIAVLEASKEAAVAVPVVFAEEVVQGGLSVASLGFPLPPSPEFSDGSGRLPIAKRLATGHVSTNEAQCVIPDWPWVDKSVLHYELNMFVYGGISGGPVFDLDGRVVGVSRGSQQEATSTAGYGYATRNIELFDVLERIHTTFTTEANPNAGQ